VDLPLWTATGSRQRSLGVLLPVLFLALTPALPLRAEEAGTFFGAHLLQPKILTAPAAEGAIDLTCTVGLLGGCCFPLTSHNISATLTTPPGVVVVSGPEPARYPAIAAPVSGTPQAWATFRWRLKRADSNAEASITVTVTSSDSGQVQTSYALGQVASCAVTGPELPQLLRPDQEVPLTVDAHCLDEEHYVKGVRFWYTTEIPPGAEAVEAPADLGDRGILRFSVDRRQRLVQGQAVDLARKYEPTKWYGILAARNQASLYGFAVATDDAGRASCGPVVHAPGSAAESAASAPETSAAMATPAAGSARFWALGGIALASAIVMILVRRQGPAAMAGVAGAEAMALLVVWFAMAPAAVTPPGSGAPAPLEAGGYPADGAVLVYLFLDGSDASRQLAERLESYRQAAPHRIHLLCFVEGITPAPLLSALKQRYGVVGTPGVLFDAHLGVDAGNPAAVDGTLDRCFGKPAPRLSMEMHGGVIAGSQLSLGFIMCNHGARRDVRGSTATFVFENDVPVGRWRCGHVVRERVAEARPYLIPIGKCQPPAMLRWAVPAGVEPARIGALTVVLDERGHAIDSICTEKPCSRTGVCG